MIKFFLLIATLSIGSACSQPISNEAPILEHLVRQPSIPSANPPLLLMLHGLGSNEQDMFSLAPHIDGRFLVISVRAPFTKSPSSYKWYTVDFTSGRPSINADEAEQSCQLLLDFIEQLKGKHRFDDSKVYLCGFSQGAIMSYSVGLSSPEKIRGIAAFSGRYLEEAEHLFAPKDRFGNFSGFISHGTADNVLPVGYARQSRELFNRLGIPLSYHEYEGVGHSISKENLNDFLTWLAARE